MTSTRPHYRTGTHQARNVYRVASERDYYIAAMFSDHLGEYAVAALNYYHPGLITLADQDPAWKRTYTVALGHLICEYGTPLGAAFTTPAAQYLADALNSYIQPRPRPAALAVRPNAESDVA